MDNSPRMTTTVKEAAEQRGRILELEAEVAELKRRLGGKERECEDYEKLLGKYLHAGEEADMDMVHLRAEVAELKGLALDVWEWRDRATVQNHPAAAALMRERFRKHGLLEE